MAGVRLYRQPVEAAARTCSSILYVLVDDIHAAREQLAASSVPFGHEPHFIHTHADGTAEWMTFFSDPDGNQLALASRVPAA
jgi:extradiol dioxygenase family protein